ncbi:MAG: hypothetical protein IID40_06130 [Planctomycetes bacterium]|nr:hypothetical protein [Planctomycetota bacterium]
MVAAANEAFAGERFDEALAGYEEAASELGDSAELDYNRAAALYKLGRNEVAANLFAKAAMSDQPDLRRRAKFNWGNCDYATVLEALKQAAPDTGQQPDLPKAIEKLGSAMRHYRDALRTEGETPAKAAVDRASRGNIERARRMIDTIQEMMEQQEQQQNQDQDQDQDQENQEQDQSQQDDQQDQQQDPSQQDENQEGEQQEEQQQDQQQENQEQGDEQQPSEQQEPEAQEQPQPDPDPQREMTPQEADALLQAVRDKEKQRREKKMRKLRARRVPVIRDW